MLTKKSFQQDTSVIFGLCVAYFVIQSLFIPFATLSVDDFWLAYHTYHFKSGLPYRDFAPYKTVMGYYILLLPMLFFSAGLKAIYFAKAFLALINMCFLGIVGLWLTQFFHRRAIYLGLAICIFSQFFMSYSTEFRVDILAYWLCLISILLLFEKKYAWAGIVIGFGFVISQKTLWYIFATDVALLGMFLVETNLTLRERFLKILTFNFTALLPIAVYIGLWSALSSLHTVLHSIFYEAYLVADLDSYNDARLGFWQAILENNALFCLLAPATFLMVLVRPVQDTHFSQRIFLILYAMIIGFFIVSYKQPFPYNISATLPAFLVLYAAFFSWIVDIFNSPKLVVNQTILTSFTFLYFVTVAATIFVFNLSVVYFLICAIPGILITYILTKTHSTAETNSLYKTLLFISLFTLGIIYPTARFIALLPQVDGHYQKYMLSLADTILTDGGDYIAGEPLFLDKQQPIPGLIHLVVPALEYYYHPSDKLFPVMNLSSLYLTPATTSQMIEQWKHANIKLYINNNRFYQMPADVREFLSQEYEHYWGSIYIYAPIVKATQSNVWLKFQANYRLESPTAITLDGQQVSPNQVIPLTQGDHAADASNDYRLVLTPDINQTLDPKFEKDNWNSLLL